MTIYNIPIEPYEERYSKQWYRWIFKEFHKRTGSYHEVKGNRITDSIKDGVFLDVCGTNYWKSIQLALLCQLFHTRDIRNGDVLFFHDLWFPGLEMVAYMRDALEIDVKICGILHAGTYDPWDFLYQKGMDKWGGLCEMAWLEIVDAIFVATRFHKELFVSKRTTERKEADKIYVTGLPIYNEWCEDRTKKENIVVFPHRLDVEKGPNVWENIIEVLSPRLPHWDFISTKEATNDKEEYYQILNRSKIAVSCARQETWGIAMQECLFCDCFPVVPNRLSYPEMYVSEFIYNSTEELVDKIVGLTSPSGDQFEKMSINREWLELRGKAALPSMISIMEAL